MSDNAQMRECAQEEQKPAATVMHVRMAKASQADLDTAYRIMNLLASMDRGHYPSNEEGSPTFFDSDDWEHLQFLHQQIIEIADNSGGVSRVIGAAGILLNPKNNLIDPEDDFIEPHPDLKAGNAAVEELRARVAELEAENASIRDLLSKKVVDSTMLSSLSIQDSVFNASFEGGAAGLLVDSFVEQFRDSGATNYIELYFADNELGEFVVTMQRKDGDTPAQQKAKAVARVAELEAELETAKRRIVHLDCRLSEVNGEVLRLEMANKHMLKLQEERDAAVIKVATLESELAASRTAPESVQCETCGGTGEIDESIGGEHFSNKHATCQDCDGSGVIESIHDFRAGQWWVKALDEIWGSTSPDVTPDQKRAVAVVHNLLRHVANLGRVTVSTDESGRAVAVTRQDDEHRILSVIWEAPVTAPVRLTDEQLADAACNANSSFRAIETAVLRANGFKVEDE